MTVAGLLSGRTGMQPATEAAGRGDILLYAYFISHRASYPTTSLTMYYPVFFLPLEN